jgi:probable phosphoglycerate mutase
MTLIALRDDLGPVMAANEAQGLDFRPEGGESPRDVQDRLRPWLSEIGAGDGAVVAITHRGVMRSVISLALNWDMKADAPSKLEHASAQFFFVDGDGTVSVDALNQSLLRRAG